MNTAELIARYEKLAEPFKTKPAPEAFRDHVGFIYAKDHSFVFPSHSPIILYTAGSDDWSKPEVVVVHIKHPDGKVSTGVYYEMGAMGVLMTHLHMSWRFKPRQIAQAVQSVQQVYKMTTAVLGASLAFGEEES